MRDLLNVLLTPDGLSGPGGGGGEMGAAQAPSSAPSPATQDHGAAGMPSAQPPAPQPQEPVQRTVSADEYARYQRYEQQAKGAADQWRQFQQMGYQSMDQVQNDLNQLSQLRQDQTSAAVLNSLAQSQVQQYSQGQADPYAAVGAGSSVDPNQLRQLVQHEVGQIEANRLQAEHNRGSAQETELLHACVDDARFRSIFVNENGEPVNYEQAFAGEATPDAVLLARALDTAIYQKSDRYQDGSPMPLTDPAKHRECLDEAWRAVQALQAKTLVQASQATGGENMPGHQGHVVHPQNQQNGFPTSRETREAQSRAAAQTMASEFRRLSADQSGLPASQGF